MANHKGARLSYGGKTIEIEPGQFWTSLKSLRMETGLSLKNLRTAIKNLEKLDFLASEPAANGRLITVIKWDTYQVLEIQSGSQNGKRLASDWQSTGNQVATNNKEKNNKNERIKEENKSIISKSDLKFKLFWDSYPLKKSKSRARECWNTRIRQGADMDQMILAAKNYAAHCETNGTNKTYIKHPSTFIGKNEHWEDWIQTEPVADKKDEALHAFLNGKE